MTLEMQTDFLAAGDSRAGRKSMGHGKTCEAIAMVTTKASQHSVHGGRQDAQPREGMVLVGSVKAGDFST